MSQVLSVRLEDDVATKLDQLATSLDRPRSWLIEQAIATYVEEQSWQIQAITDALDDYRSGEAILIPHDQVMARLKSKLSQG